MAEFLAFNGDKFLAEEFLRLKEKFGITTVVETGTYHGVTTEWLAENFDKVITIEVNPEYHAQAVRNWINHLKPEVFDKISLVTGDSSKYLIDYLAGADLVFLDAHWWENPVLKELEQIAASGLKPVIAIHDFQVPGHPELGYDYYEDQGIVYNFDFIKEKIEKIYGSDYEVHYNSQAEGSQRGCVFITPCTKG